MTTFSRLLLSILVVGGVGLGLCSWKPDWAETVGLDLWNLPALEAEMAAQGTRRADLDAEGHGVLERIVVKGQLSDQVLAGHLELLPAAARFRDLSHDSEDPRQFLQLIYPGANDDERYCRAVISWVSYRDNVSLAERERRVLQLEADLDDRLCRDGRITLPR